MKGLYVKDMLMEPSPPKYNCSHSPMSICPTVSKVLTSIYSTVTLKLAWYPDHQEPGYEATLKQVLAWYRNHFILL